MYKYITKAELRGFGSKISVQEQATLRKSATATSLATSVFLSHSSKDNDLIIGAASVLKGHGASVYLDEVDPAMPPSTSEETAKLLKQRIRGSKKFVLLASDNSRDSRWVPWELGIADGYKGVGEIALFPASDKSSDRQWASWEYLGLYPRIVWGDLSGHSKKLWMVVNERKNEGTPLTSWLSKS